MKSFDEIEEKMKKLDQLQSTDPPAFVWDNIEAELDQGKRRKFLFIFLFGMSMFLMLVVAYKSYNHLSIDNAKLIIELDDKIQIKSEVESGKSLLGQELKSDNLKITQNTRNDIAISEGITTAKSSLEFDLTNVEKNKNKTSHNAANNNLGSNSETSNNKNLKLLSKESKRALNSFDEKSLGLFENESNDGMVFINPENGLIDQSEELGLSGSFDSINNELLKTKKELEVLNSNSFIKLKVVDELENPLYALLFNRDVPKLNVKLTKLLINNRMGKGFSFDLNWARGSHYAQQEEFGGETDTLKISESGHVTNGFKIGIQYKFDNKMSIAVGLDYLTIKDSLSFSAETFIRFLPPEEPEFDSIPLYEDVTFESLNRYKMIDIPIVFGYEFPLKGWRVTARAGLILNLSSKGTGNVIVKKNESFGLMEREEYFRTGVGLGVIASVKMLKPINHNIGIMIAPTFKRHVGKLNDEVFKNPRILNVFTIDVGLSYSF